MDYDLSTTEDRLGEYWSRQFYKTHSTKIALAGYIIFGLLLLAIAYSHGYHF